MCVSKFYISPLLHPVLLSLSVLPSARTEQYNYQSLRACTGRLCVCAGCEGTCVCAQDVYECQEEAAVGAHTASRSGSWDRKLCCRPNQRLKAPIAAHKYLALLCICSPSGPASAGIGGRLTNDCGEGWGKGRRRQGRARVREGSERWEGGIRLKENTGREEWKEEAERRKRQVRKDLKQAVPLPPFFRSLSPHLIFFSVPVTQIKLFSKVYIFLVQYFLQEIAMLVKSFFTLCNKIDLNI